MLVICYIFDPLSVTPLKREESPASRDFDEFSEWLAQVLDGDTHYCEPPRPHARAATDPPSFVAGSDHHESDTVALDWVGPPSVCPACGAETELPLLCLACLERIEKIPDDILCGWYVDSGFCAARVDYNGGDLVKSACGGRFAACEQIAALYPPSNSAKGANCGRAL